MSNFLTDRRLDIPHLPGRSNSKLVEMSAGFLSRMPRVNFWGREAKMVSQDHKLSARRQCALLTQVRSNLHYHPKSESAENLRFMGLIDK